MKNKHNSVSHLRAFIAYAAESRPDVCFTLIPYPEAIAAGIPFAVTFVHEGLDWAVWLAGDCSPFDLIALEQAGVVDPEEMTGTGSEAQDKANKDWNEKARKENRLK